MCELCQIVCELCQSVCDLCESVCELCHSLLMLFPYLDITYHGRVLGHLVCCRCELPPYL